MRRHSSSARMVRRIVLWAVILVMIFSTTLMVSAASTTKASAEALSSSDSKQAYLDGLGTSHWYKVTPEASGYYRFTILNQSVEVRTGISIADHLLNVFLGKMSVTVYDQYSTILAEGSVRCGYSGSVSLKLNAGSTYYIKLSSTVAGNYRLTTKTFSDMGSDSWSGAEEMLSNGQLISSVDASGDKDWFKFVADDERSFYRFALENISGNSSMHFYLYEYVEGAGETPLRDVLDFSVSSSSTNSRDVQLKEGMTYYYCINGAVGGYMLNVYQTLDVAGADFDGAYSIPIDTKITTSFDGSGDVDMFKLTTGTKDAYYHFDFDVLSDLDAYLYFHIYDSYGNDVADKTSGYRNDSYNFDCKLTKNSTYYLRISKSDSTICNYTLTIVTQQDRYPDVMEGALTVKTDTQIKSSFDGTGDVDWMKFTTGTKDAYYDFDFDLLSDLDCYLYFYICDADGNDVADKTSGYRNDSYNFACKLTKNSTYYLRISKSDATVCNYTLTINTVLDPESDSRGTALKLSLNTVKSCRLASTADVDWFKFTVEYDDDYRIRLNNETAGSIRVYLYNSRESCIKSFTVYDDDNYVVSLSAGTYYLAVERYSDSPKYYSVAVAECGNGHTEKVVYSTKAAIGKTGTKKTVCKYCGVTLKTEKVAAVKTIKVSWSSATCNGKVRRPTITVTDVNGNKITSFSVKWSNSSSKNPGKYTATVTLKGAYSGSKTLTYKLKLATPTVTASGTAKGNKVTWNKVAGATTYKVYVRSYSNGKWGDWKVLKTTSGTSYTHTSAAKGKYYRYTVIAYRGEYKSDSKSSGTAVCLAAPSSVKATGNTAGNKVTWSKVTGAKEYQVYARRYSDGKWGAWKRLTTTAKMSYTHKKAVYGDYYQYKVRAIYNDSVGVFKESSKVTRLTEPTITAAKSGSAIKASWTKVTGAQGYVVYRRYYNSTTKKWSDWVKMTTTTSRSYVDHNAKKGVNYQYAVKAYKGSSYSDYASTNKVSR